MEDREFDIIVFGASGFTGQYVAQEVAKCCKSNKRPWAVAGRSKEKLSKVIESIEEETGYELNEVAIIPADVEDEKSLVTMCSRAKIVLACVGPYRFYGEPVVKACVKSKTHYLDISGEPEFLETMQLRYNEEAKDAGIHIIGACGFDSIPVDCGIEYMRENFQGELTAVETYINYHGPPQGNIGTFASIVHGVASSGNLKEVRKQILPKKLKTVGQRMKKRGSVFYSKLENQWSVLFMGADPSIVKRTQFYQQENYGQTPIQYGAYFCMQNFMMLLGMFVFGLFLAVLTPFKLGRKLLTKYPRIFTFGVFSHDGVTRKVLDENGFSVHFYGRGYSSDADRNGSPDKALGMKLVGPEAGYVATPIFMVQAAITILEDKLPNCGGVLTPGSAFRKTGLIERLKNSGIDISFNPLEVKDLH